MTNRINVIAEDDDTIVYKDKAGNVWFETFNFKPCEKNRCVYCNCEGFYPACRQAPASVESR
ncbi:hypothetical protein EOA32_00825 [Mesorhizobium sp. M1A.F.Ca.ET.072.01.1.1]|uniref:hypothetical protein n=1 Tax=Mesorhizobium sp. M1A.F.Ca.ET.072.01.1.1 TaxID=2496753 RepID=UPI000FD4B392|nr:hypothetical protein [Mesorhizobium sp. M1A.F.Ca.ET.072.01.1.1]RUW55595.1 hypothetical protein EOA32_00825 [Mesorhizobium sp. M1A.F.Ca.ET.072.01.1.1]